jgi:hypothetical protein
MKRGFGTPRTGLEMRSSHRATSDDRSRMSLYVTESGRRITPEFPDDLSAWPELAKTVSNAQRLEREFQEAGAAHLATESALEVAVADDRARLAEKRLKGRKKVPEARAVGNAKASLDEAERQRNAADDARRRAAEIVVETLEQHRADYVQKGDETLEAARSDEAAALLAYLEAVGRSATAQEVLTWLRGFPEKRNYRPTTPHVRNIGRNEPIGFDELVDALKVRCGLADPPPRTLGDHVRAASREPAEAILEGKAT